MVVAVSLMAIRSLVPLNVAGVDVCFVHSTLSASDQKACMLTDDLFKRHSGMVWDPGQFTGLLRVIESLRTFRGHRPETRLKQALRPGPPPKPLSN